MADGTNVGYVDIYMLPIVPERIEDYREHAAAFAEIVTELGALSYREFRGDDLGDAFTAHADGRLLTAAVAEFRSREHRDEVMAAVMEDPRFKAMDEVDQMADMSAMRYGGFEAFVTA